jgi:hypothetical protein
MKRMGGLRQVPTRASPVPRPIRVQRTTRADVARSDLPRGSGDGLRADDGVIQVQPRQAPQAMLDHLRHGDGVGCIPGRTAREVCSTVRSRQMPAV